MGGGGMAELPCDADGRCMCCKVVPPKSELLLCKDCVSPWHMPCLKPPLANAPPRSWSCPDCNLCGETEVPMAPSQDGESITAKILAIQNDASLSEQEKARRRQELLAPKQPQGGGDLAEREKGKGKGRAAGKEKATASSALEILDEALCCVFCMNLCERPVTTPCQHNFCLKCFQRWSSQGKKTCSKCRAQIPRSFAENPRINSSLVYAIRLSKAAAHGENRPASVPQHYMANEKRPDKAFTTERAVKTGKANACSGRIFVTIPSDHFGPIPPENDPSRNQGVLVGETWEDRMECRQWGAHFPHVAGIAGQSGMGAQSVALSGGYEDDEDHGEYFLYTGSGGRDLSGNKRTNKEQSFDQTFDKMNKALLLSCKKGLPVRVVRSHKEKRSPYAPPEGVRYDGIYRIEKCWRHKGQQDVLMCRYLFVRCDNEPAPWVTEDVGDRPRPLPAVAELKKAKDVQERKGRAMWDWLEEEERWGWTCPPPVSRGPGSTPSEGARKRKQLSLQQKLLKEFSCRLCSKVLESPVSTPCGHNFCKSCLEGVFSGTQDVRARAAGARSLRVQRVAKPCPSCKADITAVMADPKVNCELEDIIKKLQEKAEEAAKASAEGAEDVEPEGDNDEGSEGEGEPSEAKKAKLESQAAEASGPAQAGIEVGAPSGQADSSVAVKQPSDEKAEGEAVGEEEFKTLCAKHPAYEADVLRSMLADQGGDVLEVDAMLKRMTRQAAYGRRRQSGEGLSPAKKPGRKRGRPARGSKHSSAEDAAIPGPAEEEC